MKPTSTVYEEWEMRCPECSKDDGIEIACTTWMLLTPDGTEVVDHEWATTPYAVVHTATGSVP